MWDLSVFPEISAVAEPNERKTSVIERLNEKKSERFESEAVLNPLHVGLIEKLQTATHPYGFSRNRRSEPEL